MPEEPGGWTTEPYQVSDLEKKKKNSKDLFNARSQRILTYYVVKVNTINPWIYVCMPIRTMWVSILGQMRVIDSCLLSFVVNSWIKPKCAPYVMSMIEFYLRHIYAKITSKNWNGSHWFSDKTALYNFAKHKSRHTISLYIQEHTNSQISTTVHKGMIMNDPQ